MIRQSLLQKSRWMTAGFASSLWLALPLAAWAQIAGDGTLGSRVNGEAIAPCTGTCIISDGTTSGGNLFHSFSQFSLTNPTDSAGFITNPGIQNVIVRVTGIGEAFTSKINGTILTGNPANFFLLNPNGIILGPGATLLNGGSFLATTARELQFQDGIAFRTTDVSAPLLSINVPIGLQFGPTPGSIQMQGSKLSAGKTDRFSDVVLVGGDIVLDKAEIRAPGRQVVLAGVGENGTVGLQRSGDLLRISSTTTAPRRDIALNRGSVVDIRTDGGRGGVGVVGRNIALSDNSTILTGITTGVNNAANQQSGDINIDASSSLKLTESAVLSLIDKNAIGNSGNIEIKAADLSLRDGSGIFAYTYGNGNAGNVQVKSNSISLNNSSPNLPFLNAIASLLGSTGSGRSGNVTVETDSLLLKDGAAISTDAYGNGNAGNVRVRANTILLDGVLSGGESSSLIGSGLGNLARGSAGNVTVETDMLSVTNGAGISAGTSGNGDAGNVQVIARTIALDGNSPDGKGASGIGSIVSETGVGLGGSISVETDFLNVTNGAVISAGTFGNGNGGNIRIVANTIRLDGVSADGKGGSGIGSTVSDKGIGRGGNVIVKTDSLTMSNGAVITAGTSGNGSGGNIQVTANSVAIDGDINGSTTARRTAIASEAYFPAQGQGGNINLKIGLLTLTNGAAVSTSALGEGSAGNIDITAGTIRLDRSEITAQSIFGDGANITLDLDNVLLMRRNSGISTSAGLLQTSGNGGKIMINAPRGFLIALPENNDITANAFNGRGGNLVINAQAIYQFQPRSRTELTQLLGTNDPSQLDPDALITNDITAISQGSPTLNGTVAINRFGLDLSRGLATLPDAPTDPSNRIDRSCSADSSVASTFTVTGPGGLPATPQTSLPDASLARLARRPQPQSPAPYPTAPSALLQEAQAAEYLANGQIRLTATPPSDRKAGFAAHCH